MAVYVDNMRCPYGRMFMSHMMADTEVVLHDMADRIGVARRWIQKSRKGLVHYDICQSKRAMAVRLGAVEVNQREVANLMRRLLHEDGSHTDA